MEHAREPLLDRGCGAAMEAHSVVEAYEDECGTLDFHPPELDFHYLGGGGALSATYDEGGQLVEDDGLVVPGGVGGSCSVISCEMGVCIAGQCNCAGNFSALDAPYVAHRRHSSHTWIRSPSLQTAWTMIAAAACATHAARSAKH